MPLKREELREFAVVGARARLVDLEKERQRLFAEFPELERSYAAASEEERPAPKTKRAPKNKPKATQPTKRKTKTLDKLARPKTVAFLQEVDKPVRVVEVAQHFKMGPNAADQRLRNLAKDGIVRQIRKIFEGKSVNLWELTSKGEKMEVPVNGAS